MTAAALALTFIVLCVGCGGSEARPPEAPPAPEPEKPAEPERSMQVQGQLGSIEPRAVDAAFNSVLEAVQRCHTDRLKTHQWLSGDVKIFLRLGEDGAMRYGFIEDTTLGDRDAESCIMHVMSEARWPQPRGGEAEVRKSVGFDAPSTGRPPVIWASEEITPSLVANNAKIRTCRGRVAGSFKATAWVIPAPPEKPAARGKTGKRKAPKRGKTEQRGRIVTVGIAPPNREGLESIDCLVETLKQMNVPSPGSSVAKVTFSL